MTLYRLPPAPISDILAAEPTPALAVSPDRRTLALLGRENLPGIDELAAPELRLAGVRINPATHGPSRESFFHSLRFRSLASGSETPVQLPADARLSFPRWSPDGSRLAFVNTTAEGLELWLAEVSSGAARILTKPTLNATLGAPFAWLPDSQGLLLKRMVPGGGPAPAAPSVPAGPVVRESSGRATPARTYQDLLENPHQELLFEHFFTAQIALLPLAGGEAKLIGEIGIFSDFTPSPDGRLILTERIHRPFSYLVPWYRFPACVEVWDLDGHPVHRVADLPLAEDVPVAFDAVPDGPRAFAWRSDAPATLAWAEALDGGDPRRQAAERDRVLLQDAPFDAPPRTLLTLEHRYAGIQWGRDDFALVYSRWWNTRTERRFAVAPGLSDAPPRLLVDRSYQDRYSDPGSPVTRRNASGLPVLLFADGGSHLFLAGEGASPAGDYPFLDRMDVRTGAAERLWRAEDPYYEQVAAMVETAGPTLLTRRESPAEPPNYFLRDLARGTLHRLTDFADPAPQLAGLGREIVTYAREDGVKLSATLFTPPGYDAARDGPLPLLMWAYPREFRDADAAGQIDDSPNRFSRPAGASHLFLLTQGYAILDGPAMPIIGEGEAEPNDSYVEQLVANARAAIEHVVGIGVADRDRIGIGGHSYGAFMAANLLAHSDLFRAGIARSGAYNRTLTPFGFQQEQRTYWEAPDTYHRMSPFGYAHRIQRPILLIHGEADNNSGTFPVQSERFYHALKGHGATVRYVVLPHESHGYRARESVLHTLAEMVDWMDRHVKRGNMEQGTENRPARPG